MGCIYAKEKIEHPTSGACRHMTYCKKYNRYCLDTKDCKQTEMKGIHNVSNQDSRWNRLHVDT